MVQTRCHGGHSRLTNIELVNNEQRPKCIPYNYNYSQSNVLSDCVDVTDILQTFYNISSLSDLLNNVAVHSEYMVLSFIFSLLLACITLLCYAQMWAMSTSLAVSEINNKLYVICSCYDICIAEILLIQSKVDFFLIKASIH